MTTSRTGTATYLRNRRRVIAQARADGLTHCPGVDGKPCGTELDYDTARLPNSAETDHVTEYRHGGDDAAENLRVICRTCNLERNVTRVPVMVPPVDDFPTSRDWLAPGG